MRIGVLGLIASDLSDVDAALLGSARRMGFTGTGAHLTVPADQIGDETVASVGEAFATEPLDFLQLWGPYPSIISEDEEVRRRGVEGARHIVRLAARLGVPASGVRPTSHNPAGDWWPHRDNHNDETERRFRTSLDAILETAEDEDIGIVLEAHMTTVLDSPERIARVIAGTGSDRVRVNIDPCNFIADLPTAFHPTPVIDRLFDILGEHVATVHVKDYVLEDRFVVHISEAVPGTGLMDLETVLRRTEALGGDTYAIVEHLPRHLIPEAASNLRTRAATMGIDLR